MFFGTLGFIILNHNHGNIASKIDVGYPYGNWGASSKETKFWYFLVVYSDDHYAW